jgi:hypothetical protein
VEPLAAGSIDVELWRQVQKRRERPTRWTQAAQVFIQNAVFGPLLTGQGGPVKPPWPVQLLSKWSWAQRLPARLVGVGVRPEHVDQKLIP